jgi:hypothetical protein
VLSPTGATPWEPLASQGPRAFSASGLDALAGASLHGLSASLAFVVALLLPMLRRALVCELGRSVDAAREASALPESAALEVLLSAFACVGASAEAHTLVAGVLVAPVVASAVEAAAVVAPSPNGPQAIAQLFAEAAASLFGEGSVPRALAVAACLVPQRARLPLGADGAQGLAALLLDTRDLEAAIYIHGLDPANAQSPLPPCLLTDSIVAPFVAALTGTVAAKSPSLLSSASAVGGRQIAAAPASAALFSPVKAAAFHAAVRASLDLLGKASALIASADLSVLLARDGQEGYVDLDAQSESEGIEFAHVPTARSALQHLLSARTPPVDTPPLLVPVAEIFQRHPAVAGLRAFLAPKLSVYAQLRTQEASIKVTSGVNASADLVAVSGSFGSKAAPIQPLLFESLAGDIPSSASASVPLVIDCTDVAVGRTCRSFAQDLFESSGDAGPGAPLLAAVWAAVTFPAPNQMTFHIPATVGCVSAVAYLLSPSVSFTMPSYTKEILAGMSAMYARYGAYLTVGVAAAAQAYGLEPVHARLTTPSQQSHSQGINIPVQWVRHAMSALAASGNGSTKPTPTAATAVSDLATWRSAFASSQGATPIPSSSLPTALPPNAPTVVATPLPSADVLLSVAKDACNLVNWTLGVVFPRLSSHAKIFLASPPSVVGADVSRADGSQAMLLVQPLLLSLAPIVELSRLMMEVAAMPVSKACMQSIPSAVKAIPAAFRVTAKPVPKLASPFVQSVFKPLRALVAHGFPVQQARVQGQNGTAADGLPSVLVEGTQRLVERCVRDVVRTFDESLALVLGNQRQLETSIQWLQKGKQTDVITDADKIGMQLCLDLAALGSEIKEFRAVDPQAFSDFVTAQQRLERFATLVHVHTS